MAIKKCLPNRACRQWVDVAESDESVAIDDALAFLDQIEAVVVAPDEANTAQSNSDLCCQCRGGGDDGDVSPVADEVHLHQFLSSPSFCVQT